ncbi:MAG: MFS transporter [Bacteroidetes bacterium]|nr:MFS transporter [Bacteroidota bacterium]
MLSIQRRLTSGFYMLLSLPATAMGFALSVQISALSWILTTQFNLDIHEVGLVWAAGPLAGIFGQVIIGLISDKVWFWSGRRRPFILIGGFLAALMLLALPNIGFIHEATGVAIIFVAVTVALTLDLAINISFNPTRSVIADVTPEGNPRTKGYTWMQTISGFFGVLAYFIGAQYGNITLIYLSVFLVLAFSLIPPFFITEPRELETAKTSDDPQETVTHQTEWMELIKLYVAHGFSWLGIQAVFVYIIAFIQQKMPGLGDAGTGQVISYSFLVMNFVGFLFPAFILEPVAERIGRVWTHTLAVALMAIGYFGVIFYATTPMVLYALMALIGIGWAAVVSLPFAIMSEKVDKSRMGFFMGIFNLSVVIPQLLVSLLVGAWIQSSDDKASLFWFAAVTLSVSAMLWLLVKEPRRSSGPSVPGSGGH